jgi:hypothetical protein
LSIAPELESRECGRRSALSGFGADLCQQEGAKSNDEQRQEGLEWPERQPQFQVCGPCWRQSETPHRGKLSVILLGTGMVLSFLIQSRFIRNKRK